MFRTYNASITLDRLLFEESFENETVDGRVAHFNRANKEVRRPGGWAARLAGSALWARHLGTGGSASGSCIQPRSRSICQQPWFCILMFPAVPWRARPACPRAHHPVTPLSHHHPLPLPFLTANTRRHPSLPNPQVAILCNHQRSVPKGHEGQMGKMQEKLAALEEEVKVGARLRPPLPSFFHAQLLPASHPRCQALQHRQS